MWRRQKVKDLLIEVEETKKVSYSKIADYQKQVTTLRGIMRNFYVQIDSLNRKNEQLMAENLEVKQQYKQVEQKNQQLSEEKQQLQQNLKIAAKLEAQGSGGRAVEFEKQGDKIYQPCRKKYGSILCWAKPGHATRRKKRICAYYAPRSVVDDQVGKRLVSV